MLRLMRFGVYFETNKAIYFHKEIIIVYLHSYMLNKILKIWCRLVRFGVYFVQIIS